LLELKELIKSVFLNGNGRRIRDNDYLRVSQPNARAETTLLVRADAAALEPAFSLQRMVAPDVHIMAHGGRPELLDLLGYRPNQVTLDVLRVRLTIDLALYDFLRRVNEGQKPSVRDLSQFQSLLFSFSSGTTMKTPCIGSLQMTSGRLSSTLWRSEQHGDRSDLA
jgi:hypothetical protein